MSSSADDSPVPSNDDGLGPVNISGLIAIIVFYLAVLAVGIYAGWRQRKQNANLDQDTILLAGRNIGLWVGVLTMGATWVGGGFINGSAQAAYESGLVWVQAPFGFGLSLFISGTFFAKKMREANYVTMIDPFTQKYGKFGALQVIPSAMGEIFWSAAILGALGSTLQVILHIEQTVAIVVSAAIAVVYTLLGGLLSVAYTDVFQISFIAFGLVLSLPFAMTNEHVSSIDFGTTDWSGHVAWYSWGSWIDVALLLLLGGIPWQCYYQRVLSTKSTKRAQLLSYGGGIIALVMAVPATLFGAVAKATNWESTDYGKPINSSETSIVLPLCLQYLCPEWVAFFGLGAVSAAVMSSTDSSMLSASSMMTRNLYKVVFRPMASDLECLIVLWVFILLNGTAATLLAIYYADVYGLFVLCGDFVYVVVFPQLFIILYFEKHTNTYGSIVGFILAFELRLLCGDDLLAIEPVISFGSFVDSDGNSGPMPFRTLCMLIALFAQLLVSIITNYLFTRKILRLNFDFLRAFKIDSRSDDVVPRNSRLLNTNEEVIALETFGGPIPRPSLYHSKGLDNNAYQQ